MGRAFMIVFIALLTGDATAGDAAESATTVQEEEAEQSAWSFSASAYAYLVPDDVDYVQPTIIADHQWLHLEARYNYEDHDTVSLWGGYNFSCGEKVIFDATPMLGVVSGDTRGFAPGYSLGLAWRWLELYSEGEYLFSTQDEAESFFYSWSTLTLSPVDWLQLGLVGQRTRVYESDLEIQRGFLVGVSVHNVTMTAHMFNPDLDEPTYVIALAVDW